MFFNALGMQNATLQAEAQKAIREQYKAKAQTIGTPDEGGVLVPITVDQNIRTQL